MLVAFLFLAVAIMLLHSVILFPVTQETRDNVELMLVQRLRRRLNFNPTMDDHLVFKDQYESLEPSTWVCLVSLY